MVVVAALFFALADAILLIPLGLLPSWVALGSMGTGADVMLLGLAVAVWDAFDEGHALRADMRRSFIGNMAVAVVFGVQALLALAVAGPGARPVLTVLMFSILAVAIAITVLADPLAGLLDRLAFARSPELRADRAVLRETETALPLRATNPLDALDDDTFARLTRRALGHYGNLSKLVASPLTALPVIDDRLVARAHPISRWNGPSELKAVLADPDRCAQTARRRRIRCHRRVAALQRAVLPLRRGRAGLRPERDGGGSGSGGAAGLALAGDRRAAALAAQLAERGRPGDRRRPAPGRCPSPDPPDLRLAVLGGNRVDLAAVRAHRRRCPTGPDLGASRDHRRHHRRFEGLDH